MSHFVSHTEDGSSYLAVLTVCTLNKAFKKYLLTENISVKLNKAKGSHAICLLSSMLHLLLIALISVTTL